MSMSASGRASRSFIIGIKLWPPATIRLSGPPSAIAAGGGSMWVAQTNGIVSRIDPKTHDHQDIGLTGRPSAIAVGGGLVWVTTTDGSVTEGS